MDLGLSERTYVITSSTRGLGFAVARELVAEGARVVVTGRTSETVDKAVVRLGGEDRVLGVVADNAEAASAERVIDAALKRFGRLDGALAGAGGPEPGGATELDDEQWRRSFESLFLGTIRLVRTAVSAMEEGGALGLVLSGTVREPVAGLALSNGLRPGLAMTAKELADELGPRGIRVFGLLPSQIDTERVLELDSLKGDPEAVRARNSAAIPLRRYGRAEEFGKVAAFLLSPAASYLTGLMVPVDGGALRHI
ncbi:SDR family oxidoreductase [Streptomyces sp. NPDC052079]|uniref:SDR family oxidoreductase n=1 Tax=Streptomyces sp. NPDC052079 TaxID=3155526 RepID=UPI00343B5F9B